MGRRRVAGAIALWVVAAMMTASGCNRPTHPEVAAPEPAEPVQPKSDLSAPAWVPPSPLRDTETSFYGVYVAGAKSGWQRVSTSDAEWDGKPAVYLDTEVHTVITMLGSPVTQDILSQVAFTPEGRPVRGHFEVSGTQPQTLDAVFGERDVRFSRKMGSVAHSGTLEITPGMDLTDPDVAARTHKLKPGEKRSFTILEPLTVQLAAASYTVGDTEAIEIGGKSRECLRVEATLGSTGAMSLWVDPATGATLRSLAPAVGMELRLEDEESAKSMPASAPGEYRPDLARVTRIQVAKPIESAERKLDLKLRVSGIPSREVLLTDARQTWSEVEKASDGKWTAVVTVHVPPLPGSGEALPLKSPADYLGATSMIEADDAGIEAQAREITNGTSDGVHAAGEIGRWVNRHVHTDASVGGIRSALQVLHDPRGVCRDYAALYAGLARAAGIPTKFAAGIVYWNLRDAPGFYYHAWNEVSPDGKLWVAIDSTRAEPWPVDATHVKFAQGDVGSMVDVLGLIGSLRIEVLE